MLSDENNDLARKVSVVFDALFLGLEIQIGEYGCRFAMSDHNSFLWRHANFMDSNWEVANASVNGLIGIISDLSDEYIDKLEADCKLAREI